jgi:hypothetical protein
MLLLQCHQVLLLLLLLRLELTRSPLLWRRQHQLLLLLELTCSALLLRRQHQLLLLLELTCSALLLLLLLQGAGLRLHLLPCAPLIMQRCQLLLL